MYSVDAANERECLHEQISTFALLVLFDAAYFTVS